MRIHEKSSPHEISKSENKNKSTGTGKNLFALEMKQQTRTISYEQEVDDLRKDIEQVGEELENEPHIGNFKKFRDLLSKLATRISNEAYRLEKTGGTAQNPRYYEIISVINTEADRLYGLIVNEQRDRMAITAKVIGIKGLVVDLIM